MIKKFLKYNPFNTSTLIKLLTLSLMKKIKLRPLFLMALFFVQCSVDDAGSIVELSQNLNSDKTQDVLNTGSGDSVVSNQTVTASSFDHQAMLINWADNIIIPSISIFENALYELKSKALDHVDSPTAVTLSNLRDAWLNGYLKWQYVEMFDIGIAEEIYYKNRINLYPANSNKIESNIASLDYNLDASSNFTAQGFNGLDYLLFGIAEDDTEILNKYSAPELNYSTYLIDLIDEMIELTNQVSDSWDDEFRDSFINSTENTATSSINKVINDFIFYFEKGFRANKIGIPAGVFSDRPLPDRVEAYYAKVYSKLLATEATKAIKNFFNGSGREDENLTGLGISDYLDYIEIDNESKLSRKINDQLETIELKLAELNPDFSVQVVQDNLPTLYAYDVIQANVVLLKVDMLQKLNINVDYADADGD